MENASKALIIAGSILIAILLIAFGVRTVKPAANNIEQMEGTMQTTETASFNSKFTSYIGTNKNRAQVMSLLNVVISNNSITTTPNVTINTDKDTIEKINDYMNSLGSGPFTVKITSYSNGYVSNISIT